MAFVRSKSVAGGTYYYLVAGVRDGKKVRQQVVAYLGRHPSVEEAYQFYRKVANRRPLRNFETEEAAAKWYGGFHTRQRARRYADVLNEYRDPAVLAQEEAAREARYNSPKEKAKREARERERQAEWEAFFGRAVPRPRRAKQEYAASFLRWTSAQVLGVRHSATPAELKSAYRRRAMETHPDAGGTAEQFMQVKEAYEFLSNSAA